MTSRYKELREKWPEFVYEGYRIDETEKQIRIRYMFRISGLAEFTPEWSFPKDPAWPLWFRDDPVFRRLIFSLGMAELVSYWKLCCPPVVRIEAGRLYRDQIEWWKDLYYNGLGEFFYTNRIREAGPDTCMDIRQGENLPPVFSEELEKNREACLPSDGGAGTFPPLEGCLIPVGGGKDSAVTIELVKKTGMDSRVYVINPREATVRCSRAGGYEPWQEIMAFRTLDENMLRLNREGYLNGHTPFSAVVAFSSVTAAYIHRLRYVVLSNESSANESTVPGSMVNHQYSKSFRFEKAFHRYEQMYLRTGVYYFSLLRPLSEFQIACYFSGLKQYHHIFRSCNAGSRQDIWCCRCPKCLFVFLILSPFLSREELRQIFGSDMADDMTLIETLEQLAGIREEKPFECVGSRDEINAAVTMTIKRLEAEGEELPALLRYYRGTSLYKAWSFREHDYFTYYDEENLLPDLFDQALRRACLPVDGEKGRPSVFMTARPVFGDTGGESEGRF